MFFPLVFLNLEATASIFSFSRRVAGARADSFTAVHESEIQLSSELKPAAASLKVIIYHH